MHVIEDACDSRRSRSASFQVTGPSQHFRPNPVCTVSLRGDGHVSRADEGALITATADAAEEAGWPPGARAAVGATAHVAVTAAFGSLTVLRSSLPFEPPATSWLSNLRVPLYGCA